MESLLRKICGRLSLIVVMNLSYRGKKKFMLVMNGFPVLWYQKGTKEKHVSIEASRVTGVITGPRERAAVIHHNNYTHYSCSRKYGGTILTFMSTDSRLVHVVFDSAEAFVCNYYFCITEKVLHS